MTAFSSGYAPRRTESTREVERAVERPGRRLNEEGRGRGTTAGIDGLDSAVSGAVVAAALS